MSLSETERQIIVKMEMVKSHRGVMALFGEHYVRPGVFSKKDGV